jgi:hypothetical protein
MGQPISIGYGKITFETASASFVCFVIEPGFVRDFPAKKFQRRGRAQAFPATQHTEINGTLMLDTLEMPDGVILAFQASHRSRGVSMRDGTIFIRVREQGAMLAVNAMLPIHRDSLVGTRHLVFQGRGDLIGLDELAEAGRAPNKGYIEGFLASEEIIQCFDIRELDAERAPRPKLETVVTMSGKEVMLQSAIPARRIRVR